MHIWSSEVIFNKYKIHCHDLPQCEPNGFPNLVTARMRRRGDSLWSGRETHLNFPGKDAHRMHFNPQGTPRRNMVERQAVRASTRREEKRRWGRRDAVRLHVCGWWFKSERPVSRARPKREQLIVMCGGRWSILIFPLNAMPRTGVHSGYGEGYEKGGEAWSRYTDRHRSYPETWSFFFTSFLRPRRRDATTLGLELPCRREEHKRNHIWICCTFDHSLLCCIHYLKTFVKRLRTIVWEAALYTLCNCNLYIYESFYKPDRV